MIHHRGTEDTEAHGEMTRVKCTPAESLLFSVPSVSPW